MTRVLASGRVAVANRFLQRDMGTCLSFDGGNGDNVQVSAAAILRGSANATVSAFFSGRHIKTQPGAAIYCERNATTGNDIFKLEIVGTADNGAVRGNLRFIYRNTAGTLDRIKGNSAILLTDKWFHVAMVKTGTDVVLYINAVSDGTGTLVANDTLTNSVVSTIGNDMRDSTNSSMVGYLDEVAVWNTNLTAAQISNIYYKGIYPSTNLRGLWRFDEGSGTSVIDSAGVQSNGTITGVSYATNVFMSPRV